VTRSGSRRWPAFSLAIATIAGASGIVYASRGSLSDFSRSTVLLAGVIVGGSLLALRMTRTLRA